MNAPETVSPATDPTRPAARSATPRMTSGEYRESLRRLHPTVYVDGRLVESVADEPSLLPGVQALGVTYDFTHDLARRR